mmetsp:Transcript_9330/g.12683  ORF Transcript_9330/g.12683 Transcript_9330/m.12683 type:complete len:105 (-) Transcript_9330:410-724(-)
MERSRDINDSNLTWSVLDEQEAKHALNEIYNSSKSASHVWADICRNKYLRSIKNAPLEMTPNELKEFHPGFKKAINKLEDRYVPIVSKPKDSAGLEVHASNKSP